MELAMEDVQEHTESAHVMSSEHSEQREGHQPDLNSTNAAPSATDSFSTLSPTRVSNEEGLPNSREESMMEERNQPAFTFSFSYDVASTTARNGVMSNRRSVSFAEGDATTPSYASSRISSFSQPPLHRSVSSFTHDRSRQGNGHLQSRSNCMLSDVVAVRPRQILSIHRSRSMVGYRYRHTRTLPLSSDSDMERSTSSLPSIHMGSGLVSPATHQRYRLGNLSRNSANASDTPPDAGSSASRQEEQLGGQTGWSRLSSSLARIFRAASNDVANSDQQQQQEEQQQQQQQQTQVRSDASSPAAIAGAGATTTTTTPLAVTVNVPPQQQQPAPSKRSVDVRCQSLGEESDPEDLLCPICREIFREVTVTSCGHTFCNLCITQYLATSNDCPLCRARLSSQNLYPNFQFNKLVEQYREEKESAGARKMFGLSSSAVALKQEVLQRGISSSILENLLKNMTYQDASEMMKEVLDKKRRQEDEEKLAKVVLLEAFLKQLKEKHESTITKLQAQVEVIESDLRRTREQLPLEKEVAVSDNAVPSQPGAAPTTNNRTGVKRKIEDVLGLFDAVTEGESSCAQSKKQRIFSRFEDLQDRYIEGICSGQMTLNDFSSVLYQTTRYSSFRVLDTIFHTDSAHGSSIVSSIDFDRDDEFFAVGGVSKDIRVYDFSMIADGSQMVVDGENGDLWPRGANRNPGTGFIGQFKPSHIIHCPVKVLDVGYKLSCVSWNQYLKFQLASSDYEGIIRLWDVNIGQCVRLFDEHERRTWSVDICTANPTYIASGSDDATVKVWSTTSPRSIMTLQHNGNVCCAKFAPNVANYLAVGTADHETTCYDLRYAATPIHVFRGHKKAVSYVRWLGDKEIVSASTDSTLKRWNLDKSECVLTYSGHLNEKNFVGLTITDDWIACGSETNSLYAYHKDSRSPIATFNFPASANPMSNEQIPDTQQFISSACWKRDSKTILAANSKGVIKVLQLDS